MALGDIFTRRDVLRQQRLDASYSETDNVVSPYADSSHLETLTLQSLYDINPDSIVVNRTTAMSIASVAKSRNLICSSIGRMPLQALRNGSPLEPQPQFLQQLQAGTPNYITVSWIVDHLIFYGRAFLLIDERQLDGRPKSVRFVPEWKAETEDGRLVRAFDNPVARNEYIRIDSNNEGFLVYGRDVIRTAKELERASAEAGANPVPSVVLKQKEGTDLTQEQIQALQAQWSQARRKKYGSVAFANSAITPEQFGAVAENLLIAGLNESSKQIARALGIPGSVLEVELGGSSLSYSNSTSRMKELLDFSLSPHISAIEETLSLFLPYGQTAIFDTSTLLRGSFGDRAADYKTAIESGVWTVDELRAMENLESLEGTDD